MGIPAVDGVVVVMADMATVVLVMATVEMAEMVKVAVVMVAVVMAVVEQDGYLFK